LSWGSKQAIEVLAPTGKAHLRLFYRVNDGPLKHARFRRALGTDYNDQPGIYFTNYRAMVRDQAAGDEVTYWIVHRWNVDGPYTYTVEQETAAPVLIVSAEDYTGEYPDYEDPNGPNYLDYYTAALAAAGLDYDVWDITAQEGAPPPLEVLSHYQAAIWYTGDDYAPTVPSLDVFGETTVALRDFMNYYGGKLFATGQDLAAPAFSYGLATDDFLQYRLGAFIAVDAGGMEHLPDDSTVPYEVAGEPGDPILGGMSFGLTGDAGANNNNQEYADTFLNTSGFLPQYSDSIAASYVRPGGPFDPHSGDYYVYSQMADQSYKRLGGIFTLPDDDPSLTFWTSYDIEADWDYMFVEIRPVGTEEWTTLPDENGATTDATGESCASGWVDQIHPHLAHYMDAECNATGTIGQWNAFTGNSSGWQQVVIDLSAYAGQEVEIYIAYASDWGTQGLGVFVDDIELTGAASQDFETDMGPWEVTSTEDNNPFNNWVRMTGAGFSEGPVVRTHNSVLMGFGFEAIEGDDTRTEVMQRVMDYLMP
jgi:hypothetical protein